MKTNRTRTITRNCKRRVVSAYKGPSTRSAGGDAGPNAPGSNAADLVPVAAALAQLNDGELCALIDVTNDVPQIVPGLLAWIGHACDWELNRRACVDFPLQTPDVAIPPDEVAVSVAVMMTLRVRFDRDAGRDACAVVPLFDAMIGALTGGERRH